jgi:hypothetical protein
MPKAPDVRATSHDRHDPMLVAALAAGDLAATDRDQAIAQTDACPECAALHADLVSIARATAALPPPITSAGRDFRISPEQAERIRRTGWRRFVPAISVRPALTRPLGVGLATFGLIGLVVTNVNLSMGSAASAPGASGADAAPVPAPSGRDIQAENSDGRSSADGLLLSPVPAASSAASAGPGSSAPSAASLGAIPSPPSVKGSYGGAASAAPTLESSGGGASQPTITNLGGGTPQSSESGGGNAGGAGGPLTPNVVFGGAIVLGLILLIASLRRGPAPA